MRILSPHAALLLLAAAAPAQNFITNGDFSTGLTGWTLAGGYSYLPQVETFDVTGLGAGSCFACSPGGQVTPAPYPPNTLAQNVLVVPSVAYEFSADVTSQQVFNATNAEAGRIWVEINSVRVLAHDCGTSIPGPTAIWRSKMCGRFTTTAAGLHALTIGFERNYLGNTATPRVRITNISLRFASGQPTFCVGGNLRLGRSINLVVAGAPNASFALFASPSVLQSGISIPGIGGTLWLNPATAVAFVSGSLSAAGTSTTPILVPNLTELTLLPTWFQPAQISGGQAALGYHHFLVFGTT